MALRRLNVAMKANLLKAYDQVFLFLLEYTYVQYTLF